MASTQAQLQTQITTTLPNNTSGLITPAILRAMLDAMVLSTTSAVQNSVVFWDASLNPTFVTLSSLGIVTGPTSSVAGHVPVYSNTTGKVLSDGTSNAILFLLANSATDTYVSSANTTPFSVNNTAEFNLQTQDDAGNNRRAATITANLTNTIAATITGRLLVKLPNAGTLTPYLTMVPSYSAFGNPLVIGPVITPQLSPAATLLTINANTVAPPSWLNPASEFWRVHLVGADGQPTNIGIDTWDSFATGFASGILDFRHARGTAALPLPLQADDIIGVIGFLGFGRDDGLGAPTYGNGVQIRGVAQAAYSLNSTPAYLSIRTIPIGSVTTTETSRFASNGIQFTPTNATFEILPASATDVRAQIENTTAASTSNLALFTHRLMSSTQIRTAALQTVNFTDTTDATRTSQYKIDLINSGTQTTYLTMTPGSSAFANVISTTANLAVNNTTASTGLNVLDLAKDWSGTSGANLMEAMTSYGDTARMIYRMANGIQSAPTAVVAGNTLGVFGVRGYYTTGGTTFSGNTAVISWTAIDTYTSTTLGTFASLFTTPSGSPTPVEAVRIQGSGGVSVGAPTTDPGIGGIYANTGVHIGITPSTSAFLTLAAGTTAKSSLRISSGAAPTSPVSGDMWFDGTDVKFRVGGTTKTFTLT